MKKDKIKKKTPWELIPFDIVPLRPELDDGIPLVGHEIVGLEKGGSIYFDPVIPPNEEIEKHIYYYDGVRIEINRGEKVAIALVKSGKVVTKSGKEYKMLIGRKS